ncbi:HAD family hydrolase [Herpetosiphon sp. NSE202]|uniref:HAD family hydrolase n=1 Tax=Herpetosiphon sp. NSE202 TaxID=3351349 RepID=UPI00363E0D1B
MTQAILFDWGGVFNPQHESLEGYRSIAQRYGHSAESLYALLYNSDEWRQARVGQLTSQAYWAGMQQKLGIDGELSGFMNELFAGEQLNQQMVRIAQVLQRRYRTGLLSNALDDLETILERWQVANLFDVVINSARVGVAKPNPQAFELAVEALGVPMREIVFIDDKLRNVQAARAFGLPTVHFTTTAALIDELGSLDVLKPHERAMLREEF